MIEVEINHQRASGPVDCRRLESAVRAVLADEGIADASISLAVVDDETIRTLNRRYLGHDRATDVLSFPLARDEHRLEGEVVVSYPAAADRAGDYGWSTGDELLLYVIHGVLHLVGCDDATEHQRAEMRRREQCCLARWSLRARYDDEDGDGRSENGKRGGRIPVRGCFEMQVRPT